MQAGITCCTTIKYYIEVIHINLHEYICITAAGDQMQIFSLQMSEYLLVYKKS